MSFSPPFRDGQRVLNRRASVSTEQMRKAEARRWQEKRTMTFTASIISLMTHSLQDPDAPITCIGLFCEMKTTESEYERDGWRDGYCHDCVSEMDAQHAREEASDAEMRRDKTE